MIKKLGIGLLALTLFTSLTGCAAPPSEKTLKIGSMPTQTAAIYAVGVDKGFFEKQHLQVELTIFSSAIERDAAATAGTLDGFLTDIMGVVNLNEAKYPYKITSSEYENFCVLAGSGQTAVDPSELDGLKVGISSNTVTEYLADTLLAGTAVEKVNLPKVPERFAALMSGDIETGVFPEPFVSMIEAKGGRRLISSAENKLQPVVFVFSEAALKDMETIQAFYAAYNETVAYMKETPYDEYKASLLKYRIVTPEMIDKLVLPLDQYGSAKAVAPEDVDKVLSWMQAKGMIQNSYSYESLVSQGVPVQ